MFPGNLFKCLDEKIIKDKFNENEWSKTYYKHELPPYSLVKRGEKNVILRIHRLPNFKNAGSYSSSMSMSSSIGKSIMAGSPASGPTYWQKKMRK